MGKKPRKQKKGDWFRNRRKTNKYLVGKREREAACTNIT